MLAMRVTIFQCDTLQDIGILCSQIPQKQFLPLTNKCRSGEEIDFGGEGGNLLSYSQASHSSGIRVWVHLFRGGITYALRLDVVFRRSMNLTVPMAWSPESCSSNQCTCISSDWSYTPRAGPFFVLFGDWVCDLQIIQFWVCVIPCGNNCTHLVTGQLI